MKELMPELRFPEFEGEWESDKIKHVLGYVDYRGKTPEKVETGVLLVTARNIKAGYIDYSVSKEYIKEVDYDVVMRRGTPEIGDVLITTEAPLGNVAQIDRENIALAQRVIKYCSKDDSINNTYIKYYFLTSLFQRKLLSKASGSTALGIKGKELHNIIIKYPIFSEQTKIADFLSAVDEEISLLTEKQEKLQTYKRGVMQKLFSQELRFKDEHGEDYPEWEEKKLGELLTVQSGRDYKHLKEGDIPVFGSGGLMLFVEDFLYDGKSVCIGRKGTIDKPMFVNGKFWTVDTLFYTNNFEGCIPEYIYQQFLNINWKRYNEAGGVPSLSKKIINNITIDISSISEQTKIANFLTAIDVQLEEVEAQIAQTKVFKQGLLQKMFV